MFPTFLLSMLLFSRSRALTLDRMFSSSTYFLLGVENFAMQSQQREKNREIGGLFVGSVLCFSDTVMNMVETELPYLNFTRTASLNDPLFMDDSQAAALRLIVVDECRADELVETLPRLRVKFPQANIAYAYRKPEQALKLLQAVQRSPEPNSVGFLPMNLHVDSWLSVLRLLSCGENHMPPELVIQQGTFQESGGQALASKAANSEADCEDERGDGNRTEKPTLEAKPKSNNLKDDVHLTERELQVLKSAAEGKQNKIIADELQLSQHTVKLHMHHVIAKLGLHNRTEAAVWFLGQQAEHQGG